jgi:hypothetical protein
LHGIHKGNCFFFRLPGSLNPFWASRKSGSFIRSNHKFTSEWRTIGRWIENCVERYIAKMPNLPHWA